MRTTSPSMLATLQLDPQSPLWREFILLYRPLVEDYLRRDGVTAKDLDDLAQEVMTQVWRMIRRVDLNRGRLRGWLRTLARNKVIDWRRREAAPCVGWDDSFVIPQTSLTEIEERAEFQQRLLRFALQELQSEFRERTWASFVEHRLRRRPALEVALELQLSENAVYINASRVLARLREFCAPWNEDEDGVGAPLNGVGSCS